MYYVSAEACIIIHSFNRWTFFFFLLLCGGAFEFFVFQKNLFCESVASFQSMFAGSLITRIPSGMTGKVVLFSSQHFFQVFSNTNYLGFD